MEIKGLQFVLTCCACPEQYNVFDKDGKNVGYVRLRHGSLICEYPDISGELIYSTLIGDGWNTGKFENREQRLFHLTEIADKVLEASHGMELHDSANSVQNSFTENRAKHSLGVAQLMQEKALSETGDEKYAKEMFLLGWLHDIGYQWVDADHAKAGGKFLESVGYTYSPEVKYHGNPDVQNPTKELTLLNWADTHVDGEGNRASFEERLQDIGKRHGADSIAYKNCQRLIDSFSE